MSKMKLYMAVTADELELPLFVTDSYRQVGVPFGKDIDCVRKQVYRYERGLEVGSKTGIKFIRIEVDDDD